MRSRTTAVAALLVLLAALAYPRPSPAQERGGQRLLGLGVDVQVTAGAVSSLAEIGDIVGSARAQAFRSQMETGLGLGGALTVPLPGPFSLRGGARFAPGVELVTSSLTCPVGGVTSRPDHCAARSEGSFWVGTVDGVYRTEASSGMPEAFVRLGAGVKSYDFSERPVMQGLDGEELSSGDCAGGDRVCQVHVRNFAGENTDPTAVLGFGLSLPAGPVRLSGELADYVSVFTPDGNASRKMQHEVFLTIGVAPTL